MYEIEKVLNHNAVIAISAEDRRKYLILSRGIGFNAQRGQKTEIDAAAGRYLLTQSWEKRNTEETLEGIPALYLDVTGEIIEMAKKRLGKIDEAILVPLADHIAFAAKRIREGESIRNPMTGDIKMLFTEEYAAAEEAAALLSARTGVLFDENETGYIALHLHSALSDENISQAVQLAQLMRKCTDLIEERIQKPLDTYSLSYNRLMNHIRYMIMRVWKKEPLKVNMNDYVRTRFARSYEMSERICGEMKQILGRELDSVEIGYLAMHIERIVTDEEEG